MLRRPSPQVLLNKTDLVGPEELSVLKHRIKHMNKTVDIIETVRSQVCRGAGGGPPNDGLP